MVKFMVGVDGSRVSHKAFEIVASLMDDRTDELLVVNLYRVQKVGKIQFHLKDSPMVRVPVKTNMRVKQDGTVWTTGQEEQCIAFFDGKPSERVRATETVRSVVAETTEKQYVGCIYQSPETSFDAVYEGRYARDGLDKEMSLEPWDMGSVTKHGSGSDRHEDLKKPVDMLSAANRPAHIKELFESKCLEYHLLNFQVLIEPKPEGVTTKDMLVRLAHDHKVDYMCLGSFGTKNKANILGSSVDWFIEHARVPLIIVRNSSHIPDRHERKKLVMFVDGSSSADWSFDLVSKDFCEGKPQNTLLGYTIFTDGNKEQEADANKIQDKFNQRLQDRGVEGNVRGVTRRAESNTAEQITDIGFDTSADFLIVSQHQQKSWARGGSMRAGNGTFAQVLNLASGTTISYRMPSMSLS